MESPEQLIERFTAFVQAETWPDSRWVLKQHPVLLGKAALEVVRSWVASIDDDDEAAWAYGYHYALLVSCQAIGFEDTFDHMIPSSGPPGGVVAPPEFEDDLRRLADLDEAASGDPTVHGGRIAVMEGILRRLDKKARPAFRGAILVNLGQAYVQLPGEGVARNWKTPPFAIPRRPRCLHRRPLRPRTQCHRPTSVSVTWSLRPATG
jgi:hypothetical protein